MSGHAVLLMHDLMTLRKMHDAIKQGHPSRILRVLKFWLPMFYAAGSYNYANETMELLHNKIHEWPSRYGQVAFNGMLVNPRGEEEDWKPTDIRVEQLNDRVKERAHGANATSQLLEKITPAMGHVLNLTDSVFQELGIEKLNQQHTHVVQHNDIKIALEYINSSHILEFELDRPSQLAVVDLYRYGEERIAGAEGGHQKHLARHSLRLRERHGDEHEVETAHFTRELNIARNAQPLEFTVGNEFRDEEGSVI